MKNFLILLLLVCAVSVRADLITATVAITNSPVYPNTLASGADSRIWTNNVTTPATQILITNNNILNASNLFTAIANTRFAGMKVTWDGMTSNVIFFGNAPLVLTASAGYCTITYVTNVTTAYIPIEVNALDPAGFTWAASSNQIKFASGIVAGLSSATNPIATNIPAMNLYADLQSGQSFSNKTLVAPQINGGTNLNGVISNSAGISGTVSRLTNGSWTNPSFTNGQNFGNAFSSPGSGTGSEQFGLGATATAAGSSAFGDGATASGSGGASAFGFSTVASGNSASALGYGSTASGNSTVAVGGTASSTSSSVFGPGTTASFGSDTALGSGATTTTVHQIMLGTSSEYVQFPGGVLFTGNETNAILAGTNQVIGQLAYTRTNNTSLANGNNAGVDPLSKIYMKVSGPSGAFTINGIARGVDGRILILQNSTGQTMTIANDSGVDPTAANRIYTGLNADIVLTNIPSCMSLIYDSAISRWIVNTQTK